MSLPYKPGADLAARLFAERTVSRIQSRDVTVWGAAEGSPEARSISTRLGAASEGEQ